MFTLTTWDDVGIPSDRFFDDVAAATKEGERAIEHRECAAYVITHADTGHVVICDPS